MPPPTHDELILLTHAGLFLAQAAVMTAVAFWCHRARRAARAALTSERAAWLSAADAERHATRAEATLPPDVIPFPVDAVRRDESPAPTVLRIADADDWHLRLRGAD